MLSFTKILQVILREKSPEPFNFLKKTNSDPNFLKICSKTLKFNMIKVMTLAKETPGEEPKKKRGRPKGTKTKSKSGKSTKSTPKIKSSKGGLTASEIAAIAETEAKAATIRLETAKAAAEEAAKKEYEAAAAEVVVSEQVDSFTNKRGAEQIFRREMGEPEFWLDKLGRAPKRPILSQDEEQAISKQVEIPTDQTPVYKPEHMLSPEYAGISNYEIGIQNQK